MALELEETPTETFSDLDSLEKYVEEEKEIIVRTPISNFLGQSSEFSEDKYFGKNEDRVKFSEDGMKSFRARFNIPYAFVQGLKTRGVTTDTLNDHLRNPEILDKMRRFEFVLNQETMTVIGIVSQSYVGYSNHSFYKAATKIRSDLIKEFDFEVAHVFNTRLHLRLLSKKVTAGLVTGSGGDAEDVTRIGLELRNSMVGDSALRSSFGLCQRNDFACIERFRCGLSSRKDRNLRKANRIQHTSCDPKSARHREADRAFDEY
jgi:hypothetical protein